MTDLNEQMMRLARDLRSEPEPADVLGHVVAAAVDLVDGADTAGISLAARRGRIRTSASHDGVPTRSDRLQEQLEEGPCRDAIWEAEVVSVPDLEDEHRWPRWGPAVRDTLGVRSMLCVRLFTHEDRLGALNLFSFKPAAFDDDALQHALGIATHAAVALAAAENIKNLEHAIGSRTVISQATGMVMSQYQLTAEAAFTLLKQLSSEENRKLADLAAEIVSLHERSVVARS